METAYGFWCGIIIKGALRLRRDRSERSKGARLPRPIPAVVGVEASWSRDEKAFQICGLGARREAVRGRVWRVCEPRKLTKTNHTGRHSESTVAVDLNSQLIAQIILDLGDQT